MVAVVKRLTGERRVGHAGTLDPLAAGVLPVCLGRATRIIQFLMDSTKAYRAEIELGVATDTYDITGRVIQQGDPSGISQEQLASALSSFRGLIWQTPPPYSALKHQGKPLYKLARAGIAVEPKSRQVRIDSLAFLVWQPPLATIEVVCGKGTYIRSLAHDLGQALGCGACLKSLVRLKYGPFEMKDAVSPLHLEDAFRQGCWQRFLYPVDSVLLHWAAIVVDNAAEQSIRHGRSLLPANSEAEEEKGSCRGYPIPAASAEAERCRAYSLDGRFLGVLRFNAEKRQWHPEKVFIS